MDPIVAPAGLAAAVTPIAKDVTKGVAKKISSNLGKISKAIIDHAVASLQIGFDEFLQQSYEKAKFFKTILNGNVPMDISKYYVNIDFRINDEVITDIYLVNNIIKYKRVVISGLAGGGKSMFMRYLTVSFFEKPRSVIPLFVDLRHINSITKVDLLTYIRTSCSGKGHHVNQEQFELVLRGGIYCPHIGWI